MGPRFNRLTAACEFYLLRHGESEGNRDGVVQGRTDYRLSALGREHARAATVWLRERGLTHCITSPLLRSSETAAVVADGLALPVPEAVESLTEIDTGIFTDMTLTAAAERFPEAYRRFSVESWDGVSGAEGSKELYARAMESWKHMINLAANGHRKLLCVTHSGILQWLIKATVGVDGQRWMPIFKMANCGISLFETRPAHYTARPDATAAADGFFGQWSLLSYVPY